MNSSPTSNMVNTFLQGLLPGRRHYIAVIVLLGLIDFSILILYHSADINDLANVIRIMCQLPVDGINNTKRFFTDINYFKDHFQLMTPIKIRSPAFVPKIGHLLFCIIMDFKFVITLPPFFFSVFS